MSGTRGVALPGPDQVLPDAPARRAGGVEVMGGASVQRPMIWPMFSNGTAKMSCRTNASARQMTGHPGYIAGRWRSVTGPRRAGSSRGGGGRNRACGRERGIGSAAPIPAGFVTNL